MARRSGLGKGLGSLIPTTERLQDSDAILRELPISEIVANTYQPRSHFDEEALVSLSASFASDQFVGVFTQLTNQNGLKNSHRSNRRREAD